jgi:serine/threonine protein kinase
MTDLIGQTIGNCRLEALLGSGELGHVFRARHIHLGRLEAIKVLRADQTTDSAFAERFRQVAKANAPLHQDHIVEVYEFGEQDGRFYMRMELLPDGSLSTLFDRRAKDARSWSLDRGLDLIIQAADGLAFAHKHGVLHRDLKPDNLMLLQRSSGNQGDYTLKIGDFGLATLEDDGMSSFAGAIGSLAYMSPEQCQGLKLDTRSDIYALGVILYEVATGLLPFITKTVDEAVKKHVQTQPPPPRQVRPDLPEALEAIILRCLAKQPDERFATASELAGALQALRRAPARSSASGPYLQLLDAQGQPVRRIDLASTNLTIGRLPGNDVVLNDEMVSRNHLRVDWNGRRVKVTDLGTRHGTLLEGARLPPQSAQLWAWGQTLQLGQSKLRLEQGRPNRISVALTPSQETMELTPGQSTPIQVRVANSGPAADTLVVTVEGLPDGWVQGAAPRVAVGPNGQATVALTIAVPTNAEARPNGYPVMILARSRDEQSELGIAPARWGVRSTIGGSLEIMPKQARDRAQAAYSLTLSNAGNISARYLLSAHADDPALMYSFDQPEVLVEPGRAVEVPLRVQARRRGIGRTRQHNITVRASADTLQQTTQATFIQPALVPIWAIPAVLTLVVLALLLRFATLPASGSTPPTPTPSSTPTSFYVMQGDRDKWARYQAIHFSSGG